MPRFALFARSRGGLTPLSSLRGKVQGIPVSHARRSIASFFLILAVASALLAQPPETGPGPKEVVLRGYTFKHQRASEALALVYPLLSPRGTVEYQPQGNTLVIRDVDAAIRRIMPVLREFDHPARPLRLEVIVVRASRSPVSPPLPRSDLPEQLTKRLNNLLKFDVFETQAQAQLAGVEGQWVVYELGPEFRVSFRFGTLMENQKVKLTNFRISRRVEGRPEATLLQANVNLRLGRTTNLGLAKSEESREALMVVLTLRDGDGAIAGRR
jgi:type II/III secretion system protein